MEEPRAVAADRHLVGDVDPLTAADLRSLSEHGGSPRVTIHLPTHRKGAEVRQDPVQLRNLIEAADRQLTDAGLAEHASHVLDPVRSLLDDREFWQHQDAGLAIFASPDVQRRFRVPIALRPTAVVGDTFHVSPLAPMLTGTGEFLVLALSQNDVRLFAATRFTIGQIALDGVPTSMAEALAHEDPERQLQVRSVGSGEAMFHGHGAGEQDRGEMERFLRAVDHGLHELLGAESRPLVLACVGSHAPIFRSITRHGDVVDQIVEGNPERLRPAELHTAAWACIEPLHSAATAKAWSRYTDALGTGTATTDLDSTAAAAAEGRVDTLFVVDHTNGDNPADVDERLDRAVLDTLRSSGEVACVDPNEIAHGELAVALLRY